MSTIYQIHVSGCDKNYPDSRFRCSSKKVYRNRPSEADIKEFVNKCSQETENWLLPRLNLEYEYKVTIVELEFIEN